MCFNSYIGPINCAPDTIGFYLMKESSSKIYSGGICGGLKTICKIKMGALAILTNSSKNFSLYGDPK